MAERDDDHFDIDDEFAADTDDESNYDRFLEPTGRRGRAQAAANAVKKGRAAWSKLEDVLAERRLKKELDDFED